MLYLADETYIDGQATNSFPGVRYTAAPNSFGSRIRS